MKKAQQALGSLSSFMQGVISSKSSTPKLIKVAVAVFAAVLMLSGAFYTGIWMSSKGENVRYTTVETAGGNSPSPSPTLVANYSNNSEIVGLTSWPKPKVTPPTTFGYTKIIDLPGIGVRASFPESVNIAYTDATKGYKALITARDYVDFVLYDYAGGGRREWFKKKYELTDPQNYVDEAFSSNNHSGYIHYGRTLDGNACCTFYYYTVVKSDKMLVVMGNSMGLTTKDGYFFGHSLDKFRSFLSTLEIMSTDHAGIDRPDQKKIADEAMMRSSNIRKTIWENSGVGFRITAPEWIESRRPIKFNDDGTIEYSDWIRSNPEIVETQYDYPKKTVDSVMEQTSGGILGFLGSEYTNRSFDYVIEDLLFPAGYCSTAWETVSECTLDEYCYTKDDVMNNLFLTKTEKFGPYTGQLRNIKEDFSNKYDCRGGAMWLIKGKDGQFIISNIYPDSEIVRLEGF